MEALARTSERERLLIVGWDGADWEILDDLIERGYLPNVAEMRLHGAYGGLNSTIPSHSWAAWATFLTGVNCGVHGVYDFVERRPGDLGNELPVSSDSIRATTFMERLSEAGHEVRAANIPVTFPPIPVRGRMIAGVAVPPEAAFVHPPEWGKELARRAPFPLNGMEWARFEHDAPALVDEAKRFVKLRSNSFEVLLEGDWSVAVCVFVAPDRLQHAFGDHLLPSHPRYEVLSETSLAASIREVYALLDAQIDRLREAAGPNTTTVLMSDHGFRPTDRVANLTEVLGQLGFAAQAPGSVRRRSVGRLASRAAVAARNLPVARAGLQSGVANTMRERLRPRREIDWSRTKAYQAVRGGGLSINLEGRELHGIVPPSEYHQVRKELRDALLSYRDPATRARPVDSVLLSDELYSGPNTALAPDLLVQPSALWAFPYTETRSGPAEWPSGAHRQRGILLASGGRTVPGDLGDRDIADVAATALAFCGVTAPGIDGRAIEEIGGRLDHTASSGDAELEITRASADLSEQEQEQMAEHLRNLGYIE